MGTPQPSNGSSALSEGDEDEDEDEQSNKGADEEYAPSEGGATIIDDPRGMPRKPSTTLYMR